MFQLHFWAELSDPTLDIAIEARIAVTKFAIETRSRNIKIGSPYQSRGKKLDYGHSLFKCQVVKESLRECYIDIWGDVGLFQMA